MAAYVPLGDSCAISYNMDRLGYRKEAYPFDWSKISLKQLIEALESDFEEFDDIKIDKISEKHLDNVNFDIPTYLIKNKYATFAHEVLSSSDLDEFKIKLGRRILRFRTLKRIKFIRLETSSFKKCYVDYYNKLLKILDFKFGADKYEFILIAHRSYNNINPIIKIIYFDDYTDDWRYPHVNWESVFNL